MLFFLLQKKKCYVFYGHDLHYNCGLYVIGVFNLFEHCISLETPVFDSYVGLERLHVLDRFFTCTLALGSVGYEI